ncbi:hypothetical protein GCM10011490_21180 [Pseudoclavibacter endophyticus]|uniref:Uncharacterized protein n=1 Tax=Pseudoclavibacter endophyticus TaxID=1778590 RepID=A0A6H9WK99_9MICO|nr:hypothetical protein [Pseudoclavibacter endophyticus]KAB1648169.1 hypothetical protein F8O04_10655 [Pseudoclavibacter endophyticus]GGA70303.1 hypothetical protein GCM10011490_21180 [Pseudoclavibacter endophyticus]
MATGMFGANPDELRSIGTTFRRSGDVLERAGFDLRAEIDGVSWFGPDADRYRETWGASLHFDATELGNTLRDARDRLHRQADEQDEASEPGQDEGCLQSTWNGTTSFFGSLFGAVWGDVQGIAGLLGFDENWGWSWDNLAETWTGMGVLIGYNPSEGTWGNWGLAGDAWTELGKAIIAWDQWGDDNAGASGTTLWNVGSNFIGGIGILGKVGTVGTVGRLADDAATAGRVVDDVAGATARSSDEVAAAGRVGDDAADAGRAGNAGHWNSNGSPDVVDGRRVDGVNDHKMSLHDPPYETGARIDPETGNLVSTSGRTFGPDDVSNHYTSATGSANPDLRVSTAEGTTPFEPNHRYVMDDGRTVTETDALGRPDYTRYTMDGRGEKPGGGYSSDPWRAGTQTSAKNWPDEMYNPGDNRGHAQPAQHRGPNEDINTPPQSATSNSYQAQVEMAISDHYYSPANNQQPLIVERHVQYGPDGHAAHYDFTVTDASGNVVDLGVNPSFPDRM